MVVTKDRGLFCVYLSGNKKGFKSRAAVNRRLQGFRFDGLFLVQLEHKSTLNRRCPRRASCFADGLAQGRMSVAGARDIFGAGGKLHSQNSFGNEIGGARAEDVHAED